MNILADSKAGLRRQMQRIERGVRSNNDYCVVLLCGAKLTSRIKSPEGRQMLTGRHRRSWICRRAWQSSSMVRTSQA